MGLREILDAGDVAALAALLERDPSAADAPVVDGRVPPVHALHYICDRVFEGALAPTRATELARTLVAAGADVDLQGGDPLNAAVSLGVPEVARLLLEAGARTDLRGLLGETALHWAAYTGSAELVARLLARGAPLDATDDRYRATPLGWALHGWANGPPPAGESGHRDVVLALVRAGAAVEPEWRALALVRKDAELSRLFEESRVQS